MRADGVRIHANKEMPPEPAVHRGHGRRSGACFMRAEAVARSLVFSLTPVLWGVGR